MTPAPISWHPSILPLPSLRACAICDHGGTDQCSRLRIPVATARTQGNGCGPDAALLTFPGLHLKGREP